MTGTTEKPKRYEDIKTFNNFKKPAIYLISTKVKKKEKSNFLSFFQSGSLGINLTGANHVIIFDILWNPCDNIQASCRAYRLGQQKEVNVYHLQMAGTAEQKVYQQSLNKVALFKLKKLLSSNNLKFVNRRVIDQQPPKRHFKQEEIKNLFELHLPPEEVNELGPLGNFEHCSVLRGAMEWYPNKKKNKKIFFFFSVMNLPRGLMTSVHRILCFDLIKSTFN
jgi:hypothetical protein